jgi:anthranilate synthase component 1
LFYISYDAVRYFEKVTIAKKENSNTIPDIYYAIYQNIIAINHFKMKLIFFCHSLEGKDNIAEIEQLMQSRNMPSYKFTKEGEGFSI